MTKRYRLTGSSSSTSTSYIPALGDCRGWVSVEAFVIGSIAPADGTAQKLSVRLASALSAGQAMSWTFRKNTTNTSLTLSISGDSGDPQEASATVDATFVRGDRLKITRSVTAGTPTIGDDYMELTVTWADADAHGYGTSTNSNYDATTTYISPAGNLASTGAGGCNVVMPFAGTVTAFNFGFPTNIPASSSRTLAFTKNGTLQDGAGGTVDTRITVNPGANGGQADFSLAFAAGDRLGLVSTGVNGGTLTSERLGWGFKVVPTTAGESAILGGSPGSVSSYPSYSDFDGRATPALPTTDTLLTRVFDVSDETFEGLYYGTGGTLNSGVTKTGTLMQAGSPTSLSASVTGAAVDPVSSATATVTPTTGQTFSMRLAATAGTQSVGHQWGIKVVQDVAPPGPISDLAATVISSTQVDLTWTAATGATSHRVERATVS